MQCKGIPDRLIRLVDSLYMDTTLSVLHESQVGENLNVKIGVRQGVSYPPYYSTSCLMFL